MIKKFVRDEKYKIIGTEIELEKNEWLNEMLKLEKELNLCNSSMELINYFLNEKNSRKRRIYFLNKLKQYELKQQKILNDLEKLKYIKTYDMFSQIDLNAPLRESLEFTPIMNEKQKIKQKSLNAIYNLYRKRQRDNVMITLDQNDYK